MIERRGRVNGEGKRIAIVVARFNSFITERLLRGAEEALLAQGVAPDDIEVFHVPGAWELPQVASRVVSLNRHDALIALGCVIRGATSHYDLVCGEASAGLGAVARGARIPVTFGVVTTDTLEQAIERAGSKAGNRGWDAAMAALELSGLLADH